MGCRRVEKEACCHALSSTNCVRLAPAPVEAACSVDQSICHLVSGRRNSMLPTTQRLLYCKRSARRLLRQKEGSSWVILSCTSTSRNAAKLPSSSRIRNYMDPGAQVSLEQRSKASLFDINTLGNMKWSNSDLRMSTCAPCVIFSPFSSSHGSPV